MNAEAETLGAADAELLALVEPELELDDELELEDELPQAETATLAVMANAANMVLLLSKDTINSSFSVRDTTPGRHRRADQPALSH